jgi:hypothetical protein
MVYTYLVLVLMDGQNLANSTQSLEQLISFYIGDPKDIKDLMGGDVNVA